MVATNGRIPLSLEGIESALARSKTGDRRHYMQSLRRRVAAFERRHRLPSDLLREALLSGKLKEELDVVKWLHAHDSLVSLENGRGEARVEHTQRLPARPASRRRR